MSQAKQTTFIGKLSLHHAASLGGNEYDDIELNTT